MLRFFLVATCILCVVSAERAAASDRFPLHEWVKLSAQQPQWTFQVTEAERVHLLFSGYGDESNSVILILFRSCPEGGRISFGFSESEQEESALNCDGTSE